MATQTRTPAFVDPRIVIYFEAQALHL